MRIIVFSPYFSSQFVMPRTFLYFTGKFLEASAMVALGVGLWIGLTTEKGMGPELAILGIGSVVFLLGRYLESLGGDSQ